MSSNFRPGDWNCDSCNNHNFARRTECKQCGGARITSTTAVVSVSTAADAAVDRESPKKKAKQTDVNAAREIIVSLDVEFINQEDTSVPTTAYGLIVGDGDGNVIDKRAFCARFTDAQFNPKTRDEFWSKFPSVLERIRREAIDDPLGALHDYLLKLETTYGPFGRKHRDRVQFRFISDNPACDIGTIDREFSSRGWRPLQVMFDDYVPVSDPSEQVRGLTPKQRARVDSYVKTPHTHWPVEDAAETYEQFIGVRKAIAATRIVVADDGSELVTLLPRID